MYFHNRAEAGRMLAVELEDYRKNNLSVVALSPGAVIVGAQVAMKLHASLMMLMTENIYLPGEHEAIAALSSMGTFTYNNFFSPGQIEEMSGEYHQFIEQKRIESMHKLNKLVGRDGEIKKDMLRRHVVILVSDGLSNGFSIDVAAEFLKTVATKKLVIATPIASVPAVDRMHLVGDDIVCLDVLQNYLFTDHYYDENNIPELNDLLKIIRNVTLHWHHE